MVNEAISCSPLACCWKLLDPKGSSDTEFHARSLILDAHLLLIGIW